MSRPETDLERLLSTLRPALDPETYAFVQRPPAAGPPPGTDAFAAVREDEGLTLIVPAAEARRQGWDNRFPCRRITLQVYSALEAVGMLAEVARWLAEAGIPANTISAVNHDHLFVPEDRADEAMAVLQRGSGRWNRG